MDNKQLDQIMHALREVYKSLSAIKVMVRESALESMIPKDIDSVAGSRMAKAFQAGVKEQIERDKQEEIKEIAEDWGGDLK